MKTPWPEFTEPERYELHEGSYYRFELNRREFIQILGAGILISCAGPAAQAQRARNDRTPGVGERLHIGADGKLTVLTGKVEVGQGSRTQITQAAAEELHVPVASIQLIMADSQVVPDDGGTAGSRTTPATIPAVRKACAAARALLLEIAAATFAREAQTLSVQDGQVHGLGADQKFSYADLADEKHAKARQEAKVASATITEVKQWRILGTPVKHVQGTDIVTGKHQYPSDIVRPGMLYGKVLRPVAYGAELTEVDLAPAKAMSDVIAVRDGNFVGFAAPTSFAAEQARQASAKKAQWKTSAHPSSEKLSDHLRAKASSRAPRRESKGQPDELLKNGAKVLRATYDIAYIQHAPMEPRAAVAEWNDDRLTVWTGTQQPSRVRSELATTFRMPAEKVRLIVPDTGGGFGGKHTAEVAIEAARLALAAKKPVSLRWTREEEFTWAYFRPAGVIDVAGALDETGALVAWEHVNFNSGASAISTPYDIPHTVTEFKSCDAPLRSGSYRALASTANTFARESFMDELATVAAVNPLEFRLRYLRNERIRDVLVAATQRFGWEKAWTRNAAPQATGVGLACGTEKGSYVATCVRVMMNDKDKSFRVVDVCQAFECGAIQNPANLKAQVEGSIVQGLGGALHEQMHFKDGKILNPRFSQYQVPRFKDVPAIDTVLLDRPQLTSVGGSETPIIGIAPAIANAVFHASGKRVRSLPLVG